MEQHFRGDVAAASQPLSLADIADRLAVVRNDLASARALLPRDALGTGRVIGALDVIDDLLRDLHARGLGGES
jgi:hypothetical protein